MYEQRKWINGFLGNVRSKIAEQMTMSSKFEVKLPKINNKN